MFNRHNLRVLILSALLAGTAVVSPAIAATDDDMSLLELQERVARNQWIKIRDNRLQNISVWYKIEDGKRLRSFKIEAVMDAPYEDTARAVADVDSVKRWFWECLESRMVKKVSDTEYYAYLKINAPQPSPDRDDVLHVTIEPYSRKRGYGLFKFEAVPTYLPVVPGLLRITDHNFVLKLTPIADNKTRLEGEGYVDPGGNMPAWAINYIQRNAPYQTILGLSRHIKQGGYDKNLAFRLLE